MASGNGPSRHKTPSPDDGLSMQNGFNHPGGSQYYGPNQQIGQRFPPHRDPRRTPKRNRPEDSKPCMSPYDSEGRPLACDLFGRSQDSNSNSAGLPNNSNPRINNFNHGPQFYQNRGHHHGNHSGQRFTGHRQQQRNDAGQRLHGSNSAGGGRQKSQGPDAEQRSSKNSKGGETSSDYHRPASAKGQRSSAKSNGENSSESSNKNSQNKERKVQCFEDPLDSEFLNLKITVTEKAKPKKLPKFSKKSKKGEASNKNAQSSSTSSEASHKLAESSDKVDTSVSPIQKPGPSKEKSAYGLTNAEMFMNPLLSPKSDGKDSKSSTPIKGQQGNRLPDPKELASKLTTEESTSTPNDIKPKKKKKKKKKAQSSPAFSSNASDGVPAKPSETVQQDDTQTDATDGSSASAPSTAEVKGQDKDEIKTPTASMEVKGKDKNNQVTPNDQKGKQSRLEIIGLEQAEKRLKKDYIFRLEKKNPKYPEALYFCRICSHHIDSVNIAHKHMKDKRHKKELKAKQRDEILISYEMPPPAALDVLSRHLEDVVSKKMLTEDEARERQEVVENLNAFIDTKLEGCRLVMFGSSVTMIGRSSSEINIEIQYSGDMKIPSLLIKLLDLLKECDFLDNVHEDFEARMPIITVTDRETDLVCVLSVHNSKSVQTTRLIKLYSMFHPKVLQLAKIFRLWGRYCDLDKQQFGSLPPHAFALMAIFYLQQENQLPVLHEVMAEHDIESVLLEAPGFEEILKIVDGDWWYYPTAPPAGENATKPEVEIDEPEETIDLAGESDCDLEITFEAPPPKTAEKEERPLVPTKLPRDFESHAPSIGELWIQMLKFYAAKFDTENLIITVRCLKKATRAERNWPHRRLAVEDPTSPKYNVCKTLTSPAVFTFYQLQLRTSVIYFLTAHKKCEHGTKKNGKSVLKSVFDELKDSKSSMTKSSDHDNESEEETDFELTKLVGEVIDDVINDVELMEVTKNDGKVVSYEGCYLFKKKFLRDGKSMVTICSTCKKEGHLKNSCPDEETVEVKPLPEFTDEMKYRVDIVTLDCYKMFVPRESEVLIRDLVCQEILEFLRTNYDDKVNLCLFGSSRNGFTFRESDLDICLTFSGNETGEGLDFAEIIEELAKTLRKDSSLRQILPITTAKVPIVKFFAPRASLEGDISLYNLLAQRNTTMLSLYASIDERCKILGYAMKAFVKKCGIGDASRGSLSSYAYTLLVIYFLQQRNPPVLPVLQELYDGDKCPEVIVDGWNAWFYEDIKNLDKVWPESGKNKESIGELWLGMLRFYTEVFDFPRHVVAIKQKKLLTAFEKEWTSKFICIEDPFDLSHNLGSAISRKMAKFISKTFVRARERFGMPPGNQIDKYNRLSDYFFNVHFLTDGQEVPNDRCCRVCGRIGHFVKDCPRRKSRKKDGDGKMKEQECFNCGMKGHYRSNCPHGRKAARDGPIPQSHPFDPFLMIVPPGMMPMLRPNIGQGSPVKPQRRQERINNRHEAPKDPATSGKRQNANHTPKKNNQQSPNPSNQPPYPSGSPQDMGRRKAANQTYSRSLSDFEYESRRPQHENPPHPSHFDPRQHQARQNPPTAKHHSLGDSPSGNIFTVSEIEARMREDARHQNVSIPRQRSNEQMIPIPSQRQPVFHSRPAHPRVRMQYSVPPMATTPPRHPGQYMPHFPSSPQNHGNQFFSPGDFPHGSDMLGRTPPSPMGQFFPGPGNIRYGQQAGPQRPHRPNDQSGFKVGSPDHMGDLIHSRTFVNSGSNEARREVHFTNPGNPGHHSYPPGPPNWNRHNM